MAGKFAIFSAIFLFCCPAAFAADKKYPTASYGVNNGLGGSFENFSGAKNFEKISRRLTDIAEAIKESGRDAANNGQLLAMLREKESRIKRLENRLEGYRNLELRLRNLEARANATSPPPRLAAALRNATQRPIVVAFDAYRNQPFDVKQSTVTYDGTMTNYGNGLDAATGMFSAPVDGVYAFAFHALARDGSATYVRIMQNSVNVAGAYRRHEGENDDEIHTSKMALGLQRAEGMLSQSAILTLAKNDKVSVFAYHGNLRDGGWHYTHFTGFLIN